MDLNRITIIGTVIDKPTASPKNEVIFSVTTTYLSRTAGTTKQTQQTKSYVVTAIGKLAEISMTYLKKDSRVYLEGCLDRFGDIIADEIVLLGSKR